MSRFIHAMFLALAVTACTTPTFTSDDGTFSVQADGRHLTLVNRTDASAFYFPVERQMAALINWAPCVDLTSDCPRVPAHDAVDVEYTLIAGYDRSAPEAIVYWWFAVPGEDGGMQPDSLRRLVVRL